MAPSAVWVSSGNDAHYTGGHSRQNNSPYINWQLPTKIVVIGAGSASFGLNTVAALMRSSPPLREMRLRWWIATPRRSR